jgi:hypothetical protein
MARARHYDEVDPSFDPNGDPWTESGPQGGIIPEPEAAPDAILRQFEGPGGDILNHNLPDYADARESESPRLRSRGGNATPSRPSSPTPMAGSVSTQDGPNMVGADMGLLPFEPMGGMDDSMMTQPIGSGQQLRRSSLFGSLGGLQGGGLGAPLDPVPNEELDIKTLLEKLMGGGGGY